MASREDGRAPDQLRPVTITRHWLDHAQGSVPHRVRQDPGAVRRRAPPKACRAGARARAWAGSRPSTRCSRRPPTTARPRVGQGPHRRAHPRDLPADRPLAARGDRLQALGENTITIDCDVLQADGGTRTAAITGAYVALADAVAHCATPAPWSASRWSSRSPPSASASSTARRCSTSPTSRTCGPRPT